MQDIGIIINQIHQQLYGDSYLQPITSLFERRTQSIPIEGIDVDAETIQENVPKKDEHDQDNEKEETPDGVIDRVEFSPSDLIVPKLDVKDKK